MRPPNMSTILSTIFTIYGDDFFLEITSASPVAQLSVKASRSAGRRLAASSIWCGISWVFSDDESLWPSREARSPARRRFTRNRTMVRAALENSRHPGSDARHDRPHPYRMAAQQRDHPRHDCHFRFGRNRGGCVVWRYLGDTFHPRKFASIQICGLNPAAH